jgi:DNA mismatch repair protein MutS
MAPEVPTLPELVRDVERSESLADHARSTSATVRGAGKHRTPFHSVLIAGVSSDVPIGAVEAPDFFTDLNLDQMIGAITSGREEYDLRPLFHTTLREPDAARYRQEVMRDVERPSVSEPIRSFASKMQTARKCAAEADKAYYQLQGRRWFLDAVLTYCDAIVSLQQNLSSVALNSTGMSTFGDRLTEYAASAPFQALSAEARRLQGDLAAIRYRFIIHGSRVTVRRCNSESDYSAEIGEVFARFRRRSAKLRVADSTGGLEMNHVEAKILELVALSHPSAFDALAAFQADNQRFLDETIQRFDREIQFYLSYMEYIAGCRRAGLSFCYPDISDVEKDVFDRDGFDLALADKLVKAGLPVVTNSFHLSGRERIIVVSGPNQGGKTTFARTFGQLHYLAGLGLPVPGTAARLFLFDRLFTHFEHGESSGDLRGKLQDDLIRIRAILDAATSSSIVVINEIFSSTTLSDALLLGKRIVGRIVDLDCLCVCVTFLDELASLDEKTVSMVSTVVPEHPAQRTFKLVRRPADGRAYAIAIAAKYRLTYDCLRERLAA